MQFFKGEQNLSAIQFGPLLGKPSVPLEGPAHVASSRVIEDEEQFVRGLESEFDPNDKRVLGEAENVSFRLGISN